MNTTKIKTDFPKMYICKYGVFYEGERLEQYCQSSGHYYYFTDIILIKFVTHWKNYKPSLYFQFHEYDKKQIWRLPVSQLGIFFRKKSKNEHQRLT